MKKDLIEDGEFNYVEKGSGPTILLLHGLFGALSNFKGLIDHFSEKNRVIIPMLPLYTMDVTDTSVMSLVRFIERFVDFKSLENIHLVGNSLGGHVALLYVLDNPSKVESITLTGSSGLFESAMGDTFPKRGSYEYIQEKTEATFYDPKNATKELVDEVYAIVNDNNKVLRVLAMARSALKQNLADRLGKIKQPTLLIWGKQDSITPPFVGEEFNKLLPHSELHFMDKTGHAPMMEHPNEFNQLLEAFLHQFEYAD